MKIGVISDIHGNAEALNNVLKDIELKGAEKIFCLGDLAMGGYDPNYTIEKIFSLKNCEIIQGNTDKLIVDYNNEVYNDLYKKDPLMANALKLDVVEITDSNKQRLKNLPEQKEVDVYGVNFLLCHGSPRKQNENLYPDTDIKIVEEAARNTNADIVLTGHTHMPCGFTLNDGKIIVNAGSVGRSRTKDKMPVYLLITVNKDKTCEFEHRRIIYDNKKVSKIIEERDFEFSKEFSKLYIEE